MNPYDVQPHPTIPGAYQATFGNGAPPITITNPNIGGGTSTISLPGGAGAVQLPGGTRTASMPLSALRRGGMPAQPQSSGPAVPGGPPVAQGTQMPPQAAPQGEPREGQSLGFADKGLDPVTGKERMGEMVWHKDPTTGELRPMVKVAATRGSPAGPTQLGKKVIGYATETEEAVNAARRQQDAANEEARAAAKGQAEAELNYRREQETQAVNQAKDQQAENELTQKHVAELEQKYQAAREAANSQHVDAGRYMRGNWLAALGSALGAAGAALGKHPNFAGDFINANIDRDIRAQEQEIAIKGKAADNALADLVREQGSMKDGKLALRQILSEKAQAKLATIAATYGPSQTQAAAAAAAAKLAEENAIKDGERKQSILLKVISNRGLYSQGSAGSAGGFITPTSGTMGTMQEAKIKGDRLALDAAKEKAAAAAGGKEARAASEGAMQKVQLALASLASADAVQTKLQNEYGVTPDKEGHAKAGGLLSGIADKFVGPTGIIGAHTSAGSDLNQDVQNLSARYRASENISSSEEGSREVHEAIVGNGTPESLYSGAQKAREAAMITISTQLAGMPYEVQERTLRSLPPEQRAIAIKAIQQGEKAARPTRATTPEKDSEMSAGDLLSD